MYCCHIAKSGTPRPWRSRVVVHVTVWEVLIYAVPFAICRRGSPLRAMRTSPMTIGGRCTTLLSQRLFSLATGESIHTHLMINAPYLEECCTDQESVSVCISQSELVHNLRQQSRLRPR